MSKWLPILLVGILVACSGNMLKKKRGQKLQNAHATLLNLSRYGLDEDNYFSFPQFFDDSLIVLHEIESISRIIYTDFEDNDTLPSPSSEFDYFFDKTGRIKELNWFEYYDNRAINSVKLNYTKWQNNLAEFKVKDGDAEEISTYKFVKASEDWAIYQSTEDFHFIYELCDAKNWKPLKVDSICHPDKDDWIVFGSLKQPIKMYHVQNIVEEHDVKSFDYEKGGLRKMEWDEAPFHMVRRFNYDKKGKLTDFIDSTYGGGEFVSMSTYTINYTDNLPVEIVGSKQIANEQKVFRKEALIYHFKKNTK